MLLRTNKTAPVDSDRSICPLPVLQPRGAIDEAAHEKEDRQRLERLRSTRHCWNGISEPKFGQLIQRASASAWRRRFPKLRSRQLSCSVVHVQEVSEDSEAHSQVYPRYELLAGSLQVQDAGRLLHSYQTVHLRHLRPPNRQVLISSSD